MPKWIPVSANPSYRANRNGIWGAGLMKVYPPGVFYTSNTSGAPGQPPVARVLPAGDQVADPRAASANLYNLAGNSNLSNLISPKTTNIGGNSYGNPAPGTMTTLGQSPIVLLGALALILWVVFK